MPFALGPDLALLKRIGPAILWLGAMLASLLTLDRLFTGRPGGRIARSDRDEPHAAGIKLRGEGRWRIGWQPASR